MLLVHVIYYKINSPVFIIFGRRIICRMQQRECRESIPSAFSISAANRKGKSPSAASFILTHLMEVIISAATDNEPDKPSWRQQMGIPAKILTRSTCTMKVYLFSWTDFLTYKSKQQWKIEHLYFQENNWNYRYKGRYNKRPFSSVLWTYYHTHLAVVTPSWYPTRQLRRSFSILFDIKTVYTLVNDHIATGMM